MKQSDSVQQQIVAAYRLTAGVAPHSAVLQMLTAAYHEELAAFKKDTARAKKLLATGEHQRDEKIDPATHAALTIVCSMIFNLDETLTRG